MNTQAVTVWEEPVVIPTYGVGASEKNPMFLEKRVYQGSSGVVYPHAVIEKINDHKQDQVYQAVFLENEYLKIMILPQLGGRIQMAYDKVKNRHFVYYNQVIKPALVGLTGPWISGGIEFNWPQHHRPSTFEPVDYTTETHPDGSKTVWVSEVERMFRTKGMAGFRLYPGKAYLEIRGVLYNRTPLPQTFLWWANPAVKVNDQYQSVFPPDIYAVFDHGKRDVTAFPIATGTYYKVDYSPGTDISQYKNIPVPTSYMAVASNYDFMGGYEHDSRGGLLHVADHHVSPGKKQWTWGNGEFGYSWDRNLTDEDGPYIELMAGVFTDNQPDFSWIMPNEERTFVQYFMPYSEIGIVKNATKEAAVNLEITKTNVTLSAYSTAIYRNAGICLTSAGQPVVEKVVNLDPAHPFLLTIPLAVDDPTTLRLSVTTAEGLVLVAYQPAANPAIEQPIPQPAQPASEPKEVTTNEQLYLTGLHIEQYRHATYAATDYYEEALRRDPTDSRCANALGLWYFRRGQFAKAEPLFRQAIQTLTQRNPNPYDGEAYYNLGLCLNALEQFDSAFDAFYKATWNAAWQDTGFLELARICTRRGQYERALELVGKSLIRNGHGYAARHLKVALLRKSGKPTEALRLVQETLAIDPLQVGCLFEQEFIEQTNAPEAARQTAEHRATLMRGYVHTYLEYALDYSQAGLYDEAISVLSALVKPDTTVYPMVAYFLAFFNSRLGNGGLTVEWLHKATEASPDFVFPSRLEELRVLQWALAQTVPTQAINQSSTWYFLGNFWYANRQYSAAIDAWEQSTALNDTFPTVFRNLALAYYNKRKEPAKALDALEKAFSLDPQDARVLMELDQLYKNLNRSPHERLARLEQYASVTEQRDDLYLERITLYNQLGKYDLARALLASRQFHPWEGGEGKVVSQYLICHIELAKRAFQEARYADAMALLTDAETYPATLGEGKLHGVQENDIHYLKGLVCEGLGQPQRARTYLEKATIGLDEPVQAIFYNDQQPDKLFYQGLAWKKLGQYQRAETLFNRLIQFGETHLNDTIKLDYFAVSLPDLFVFDADLDARNHIHCLYLMGLGHLGLGNGHIVRAEAYFTDVLRLNANHQGATLHQQMIGFLMAQETVS
jgi:tetratricopeptide (TPR) repeat protein